MELVSTIVLIDFVHLFSNAVVGESSLDRLACALGGKTMLNYILTTVQTMLRNRMYISIDLTHR